MRKYLIAAAFISSMLVGAGETGQQAIARGENGVWHARGDISCVEFLKRDKDENAARAQISNPGTYYFNAEYAMAVHYIAGLVAGVNWALSDVSDVFPGYKNDLVIELIKRQCDQSPTDTLTWAVMQTILRNKSNWQWQDTRQRTPAPQTIPAR